MGRNFNIYLPLYTPLPPYTHTAFLKNSQIVKNNYLYYIFLVTIKRDYEK
jgi:hypothetical protein